MVLERSEGIEVGAVTRVEGVHSGRRKLLLEEVVLGNGWRHVDRRIHKAWLESIVRLADHVFVAGGEIAGAGFVSVKSVEDELFLLLLLSQLQSCLLLVVLLKHELVWRGAHTGNHVRSTDGRRVAGGWGHRGRGFEGLLAIAIGTAAAGAVAAAASVRARRLAHKGEALPFFDKHHELGLSHGLVVEGR